MCGRHDPLPLIHLTRMQLRHAGSPTHEHPRHTAHIELSALSRSDSLASERSAMPTNPVPAAANVAAHNFQTYFTKLEGLQRELKEMMEQASEAGHN